MKSVINIIHQQDGSVTSEICQVPDDYIQCSVSGTWVPKSEMCDSDGNMIRTNSLCVSSLSYNEKTHIRKATDEYKASPKYHEQTEKIKAMPSLQNSSFLSQEFLNGLFLFISI